MLLEEWMAECRQDGYLITATHSIGGKYSYVMMTKEGTPNIQQIYMVRMQATRCQPSNADTMPGLDSVLPQVSVFKDLCLEPSPCQRKPLHSIRMGCL